MPLILPLREILAHERDDGLRIFSILIVSNIIHFLLGALDCLLDCLNIRVEIILMLILKDAEVEDDAEAHGMRCDQILLRLVYRKRVALQRLLLQLFVFSLQLVDIWEEDLLPFAFGERPVIIVLHRPVRLLAHGLVCILDLNLLHRAFLLVGELVLVFVICFLGSFCVGLFLAIHLFLLRFLLCFLLCLLILLCSLTFGCFWATFAAFPLRIRFWWRPCQRLRLPRLLFPLFPFTFLHGFPLVVSLLFLLVKVCSILHLHLNCLHCISEVVSSQFLEVCLALLVLRDLVRFTLHEVGYLDRLRFQAIVHLSFVSGKHKLEALLVLWILVDEGHGAGCHLQLADVILVSNRNQVTLVRREVFCDLFTVLDQLRQVELDVLKMVRLIGNPNKHGILLQGSGIEQDLSLLCLLLLRFALRFQLLWVHFSV